MKLFRLLWWPKTLRPDGSDDEYWDTMVHPDDLVILEAATRHGDIFTLARADEHFLHVTNGIQSIRVRQAREADCLMPLPDEGLFVGDLVQVRSLNGKNSERSGVIDWMAWHHQDRQFVYRLKDTSGRRLTKQYRRDDLLKTD